MKPCDQNKIRGNLSERFVCLVWAADQHVAGISCTVQYFWNHRPLSNFKDYVYHTPLYPWWVLLRSSSLEAPLSTVLYSRAWLLETEHGYSEKDCSYFERRSANSWRIYVDFFIRLAGLLPHGCKWSNCKLVTFFEILRCLPSEKI